MIIKSERAKKLLLGLIPVPAVISICVILIFCDVIPVLYGLAAITIAAGLAAIYNAFLSVFMDDDWGSKVCDIVNAIINLIFSVVFMALTNGISNIKPYSTTDATIEFPHYNQYSDFLDLYCGFTHQFIANDDNKYEMSIHVNLSRFDSEDTITLYYEVYIKSFNDNMLLVKGDEVEFHKYDFEETEFSLTDFDSEQVPESSIFIGRVECDEVYGYSIDYLEGREPYHEETKDLKDEWLYILDKKDALGEHWYYCQDSYGKCFYVDSKYVLIYSGNTSV